MNNADIGARVRGYLTENFLYMRPDLVLAGDTPLLQGGVLDSMGIMELVAFLEEEFGVRVPDSDLTEENLGSIDGIVGFVTRALPSDSVAA